MCLKNMNVVMVRQITLTLMVNFGIVHCEQPLNNQYGVPVNLPAGNNNHEPHNSIMNSYGTPLRTHVHQDENQDYIDSQPKSYEFGYAVKDSATGNDFGRQETSDGETVRGEYRVQLPDGRTQIVTYTADWRTGFHADVRYEGEATYPEQFNNGYNNNNNNNNNHDYTNDHNNGYNSGYNNLNNYNHFGFNYNDNNHKGYNKGTYNDYRNNHRNYDHYNGYNGDNIDSQTPRTTYGTPQFH